MDLDLLHERVLVGWTPEKKIGKRTLYNVRISRPSSHVYSKLLHRGNCIAGRLQSARHMQPKLHAF